MNFWVLPIEGERRMWEDSSGLIVGVPALIRYLIAHYRAGIWLRAFYVQFPDELVTGTVAATITSRNDIDLLYRGYQLGQGRLP